MKLYRVEIVESATQKVVSVIGKGLTEKQAEQREKSGISRIAIGNYFVRTVEDK